MPKKPGLPAKYAKMGFKRGWREYKKVHGTRTSGTARKTTTARTTTGRPATKTKVVYRRPATPKAAPRRTMGRPSVKMLSKKTMDAIKASSVTGLAALGSTFAIQKLPYIKDQTSWIKAAVQGVMGLIMLPVFKQPVMKQIGGGFITGAAISLAIPYMPEGFRFGKGRGFTNAELAQLQTVGRPFRVSQQLSPNQIQARTMGLPVRVGKPISLKTMGHGKGTYSRGRRNYAAY